LTILLPIKLRRQFGLKVIVFLLLVSILLKRKLNLFCLEPNIQINKIVFEVIVYYLKKKFISRMLCFRKKY
jgi:hypothetical protein